jgi:hypothetical protein
MSYACTYRNRRLLIFDALQGISDNDEPHHFTTFGDLVVTEDLPGFTEGVYEGSLDIVRKYLQSRCANSLKVGLVTQCRILIV